MPRIGWSLSCTMWRKHGGVTTFRMIAKSILSGTTFVPLADQNSKTEPGQATQSGTRQSWRRCFTIPCSKNARCPRTSLQKRPLTSLDPRGHRRLIRRKLVTILCDEKYDLERDSRWLRYKIGLLSLVIEHQSIRGLAVELDGVFNQRRLRFPETLRTVVKEVSTSGSQ